MQRHDRRVRRKLLLLQLGDPLIELRDRHLVVALRDLPAVEDRVGIEADDELRESGDFVLRRVLQVGGVLRAVVQHQVDGALLLVDREPAGGRGEDGRLLGPRRVREEHVAPAARRRRVADVQNLVGEVLEKHTRLDLVLRARGDDAVDDLAERLVRVGQRVDHDPRRRGPRDRRHEQHRPQQAVDADAARHERHRLAIRREAAERDQQADEERNGDRDRQRLRDERDEDAHDDRPRDALGDQLLAVVRERLDHQEEREDDQPQEEGQDKFPDNIAIDNPEHSAGGIPVRKPITRP